MLHGDLTSVWGDNRLPPSDGLNYVRLQYFTAVLLTVAVSTMCLCNQRHTMYQAQYIRHSTKHSAVSNLQT